MFSFKCKKFHIALTLLAGIALFGVALAADTVDVNIQSLAFNPQSITITEGTSVKWTNNDAVLHTSTSDSPYWDSGDLSNGQSFTFLFGSVGIFPYHCTYHPTMLGTVFVEARRVPSTSPTGLIILVVLLLLSAVFLIYKKKSAASSG